MGRIFLNKDDALLLFSNVYKDIGIKFTITSEKPIGEGGSSICYSAKRSDGKTGRLKELYPVNCNDIYRDGVYLNVEKSFEYEKKKNEFLNAYRKLETVRKDNKSELFNNFVPSSEILFTNTNLGGAVYVWTSEDAIGVNFQDYLENEVFSLKDKPVTTVWNVFDCIKTLTACIGYFHSNNLLHRDIKPSNFLVLNDANNNINPRSISIFDINTISYIDDKNAMSTGSVGFAAPELKIFSNSESVFSGFSRNNFTGKSSIKSDIFSIGATLFYALTGKPFVEYGKQNYEEEYQLIEDNLKNSKLLNLSEYLISDKFIKSITKILKYCLDTSVSGRYRNCNQLYNALENVIYKYMLPGLFNEYTNENGELYFMDNNNMTLLKKLVECLDSNAEFSAEHGVLCVNGITVDDFSLDSFASLKNNIQLQKLKDEYTLINKEYLKMESVYDEKQSDEMFYKQYVKFASKRQNILSEIDALYKNALKTSLNLCKDKEHGEITQRQKEAYILFEQGEFKKAICKFDSYTMKSELELVEQEIKISKKKIAVIIREHQTKINILSSMIDYTERFSEIDSAYKEIIAISEKHSVEISTLFNYSRFLYEQNHDKETLEKVEKLGVKLIYIYNNNNHDDILGFTDYDLAKLYNLLGLVLFDLKNFEKAENYYLNSLKILGNESYSINQYNFARLYLNLGLMYKKKFSLFNDRNSMKNSIEYLNKAFEIIKSNELQHNEKILLLKCEYLKISSSIYYEEYCKNRNIEVNYSKAKKMIDEAIEILFYIESKTDCKEYLSELSNCYNQKGELLSEKVPEESEINYKLAFEIRKKQYLDNPNKYQLSLAQSYYKLAELYGCNKKIKNALIYSLKSLKLRLNAYGNDDTDELIQSYVQVAHLHCCCEDIEKLNIAKIYYSNAILKLENKIKKYEIYKHCEYANSLLYIYFCYISLCLDYSDYFYNKEEISQYCEKGIRLIDQYEMDRFNEKYDINILDIDLIFSMLLYGNAESSDDVYKYKISLLIHAIRLLKHIEENPKYKTPLNNIKGLIGVNGIFDFKYCYFELILCSIHFSANKAIKDNLTKFINEVVKDYELKANKMLTIDKEFPANIKITSKKREFYLNTLFAVTYKNKNYALVTDCSSVENKLQVQLICYKKYPLLKNTDYEYLINYDNNENLINFIFKELTTWTPQEKIIPFPKI